MPTLVPNLHFLFPYCNQQPKTASLAAFNTALRITFLTALQPFFHILI